MVRELIRVSQSLHRVNEGVSNVERGTISCSISPIRDVTTTLGITTLTTDHASNRQGIKTGFLLLKFLTSNSKNKNKKNTIPAWVRDLFYSTLLIKLQNIQQSHPTGLAFLLSADVTSNPLQFSLNVYFHIPEVHCEESPVSSVGKKCNKTP